MFKKDQEHAATNADSKLRNTLRTWLANKLPQSFAAA